MKKKRKKNISLYHCWNSWISLVVPCSNEFFHCNSFIRMPEAVFGKYVYWLLKHWRRNSKKKSPIFLCVLVCRVCKLFEPIFCRIHLAGCTVHMADVRLSLTTKRWIEINVKCDSTYRHSSIRRELQIHCPSNGSITFIYRWTNGVLSKCLNKIFKSHGVLIRVWTRMKNPNEYWAQEIWAMGKTGNAQRKRNQCEALSLKKKY